MTEPAARSPWRVPRSTADENYSPSLPAPDTDKVSGIVASIEIDTCTVLVFDEEIGGVVIQDRVPSVGDEVEIERRGDLWVIVDFLVDSFIEGGNSDAWHVVDDSEPELPPPTELQVSGSMRDAEDWDDFWSGTRWVATWDVAAALMTQAEPGSGSLMSNEVFDVTPGHDVSLDVSFTVEQGAPTVVARLYLATIEESAVGPFDGDTAVVSSSAFTYTPGETAVGSVTFTVPETITTTNGNNEDLPVIGRIEVYVNQSGAADGVVRIEQVTVYRDEKKFPTGSVWFNPTVDDAAGTATSTGQNGGWVNLPFAGSSVFAGLPSSEQQIVTAPPSTPVMVLAIATGSIAHYPGNLVDLIIDIDGGGVSHRVRTYAYTNSSSNVLFPFTVVGYSFLLPGQTKTFTTQYAYTNSSIANMSQFLFHRLSVIAIPMMTPLGSSLTPPQRYWDGNSWRPAELETAEAETRTVGAVAPVKVASSSYVTRSKAGPSVGESVTITSEVSGGSGTPTGSVTFYEGPSTSGPWTKIGSKSLSGGSASMTWTAKAGTWRFRGVYGGSTTYNSSEDVTNNDTTVSAAKVTKTKTVSASWQQAYNGSGGKVSGSGVDNNVQQGYYSGTHGNRKSLIGFNVNLPSDAEVTKVELICTNWSHWYYGAGGTVVVGWHTRGSEPASWTVGSGATDRSRHSKDTGKWTVNITSWAANKVTRSDFGGIAIGPGPSTSREYYGYAASGTGPFDLKITYLTAQ